MLILERFVFFFNPIMVGLFPYRFVPPAIRSDRPRPIFARVRSNSSSTTKPLKGWSVLSATAEEEGASHACEIGSSAESRGSGLVGQARRYPQERAQGRIQVDDVDE